MLQYGLILLVELAALGLLSSAMGSALGRAVRHQRAYYLLLLPGTVVHELSHLLACLVLGLQVHKVSLFGVRPQADGTVQLGYVEHSGGGPVRRFLVGIAPMLFITAIIYLLSRLLVPGGEGTWKVLSSPGLYAFVVLAFFLGLGLSPSRQDLGSLFYFILCCVFLGLATYLTVRLVDSGGDNGAATAVAGALKTTCVALLPVVLTITVLALLTQGLWLMRRQRYEVERGSRLT